IRIEEMQKGIIKQRRNGKGAKMTEEVTLSERLMIHLKCQIATRACGSLSGIPDGISGLVDVHASGKGNLVSEGNSKVRLCHPKTYPTYWMTHPDCRMCWQTRQTHASSRSLTGIPYIDPEKLKNLL
ncbi:unnamed protein product, partial [Ilex paraguariensis]